MQICARVDIKVVINLWQLWRYEKSVNEIRSLFVLMTASKGDESTKYSLSPCDDDERSARLKAALSYLRKRRYEKSVNEFRSRIWSWWPDLNWWPHPYQGCALPPEPHQHIFGGSGGIRTPVGLHPNGFQDRLVMTASIRFQVINEAMFLYLQNTMHMHCTDTISCVFEHKFCIKPI